MSTEWAPPEEFDDYVIDRPLGSGRMGKVYLAQDAVLARPVAVKFIAELEPDSETRQRFLLEARAVARIHHPNVIAIYRVGELEQKPYIITEFVRGTTLDKLEKPLPRDQLLPIALSLARGLAAAHRRGVVHGDIKPGNAIQSEDGVTKLLDFGLAAMVEDGGGPGAGGVYSGAVRLATGISGTPDYMAPEVWRAEPTDRRSDVYSLGAVLYELTTGQPPYHQIGMAELMRVVQERDAPSLAGRNGIDPRFGAIVDRCLQRDPERRFASADDLRAALEDIERGAVGALPGGNPYRGLRPFESDHRALFFGRSQEIGAVIDRLRAEPFVLVTGGSGSGKSSLCRAGVLPAVTDGALAGGRTWSWTPVLPGRRPMRALAAALAGALEMSEEAAVVTLVDRAAMRDALRSALGDERGLVLFVDQLEELVTLADAEEASAAERALARLAAGAPGLRVLGAARADYLGRLAALPALGDDLQRALFFLRPLAPDRVREVIVGPAQATGVGLESESLVDQLVEATGEAEGSLPLLQFALAELWEARDTERGLITAAELEAMGGVAGALARHADQVIGSLPPGQAAAAQQVLTRLVTAEGTRARRSEAELTGGDAGRRGALDALVRGRLLVAHEGDEGSAYELAHDVLVRGWPTLRRWLIEDADQHLVRERVEQAAAEWQRLNRSRDALWGARQLAEATRVRPDDLGATERSFLDRSRRALARRKWTLRGLMAAVPLIVGLTYLGVQAQNRMAIDRRVAARAGEAQAVLDKARVVEGASVGARERAFALFREARVADAEQSWSKGLALATEAGRGLVDAARLYEVALAQDPSRDDVRNHLGEVIYERALLAERDGRQAQLEELLQRLRLYDPHGTWQRVWTTPMHLDLTTRPAGARVRIARYEDADGVRALQGWRPLGRSPLTGVELEPGSYLLVLEASGRYATHYPIVARRGTSQRLEVDLPSAAQMPAGYAYVPPGDFLFGSPADEDVRRGFLAATPVHERRTDGFLIGIHEVTYAGWVEYLDQLSDAERAEHALRIEAAVSGKGGLRLERGADRVWTLHYRPGGHDYAARWGEPLSYGGRKQRAVQDWRAFPVTGVTAFDAQSYTLWLRRSGKLPGARLCSEAEWERGGRGADERVYPSGNLLSPADANFDETYGKDQEAMGPDSVGSYPRSNSPFGLADMSGNAYEWTTSVLAADSFVARGGSYFYDLKSAQLVNRTEAIPTLRDVSVGFRVCAPLTVAP
ncbi:MAG TPA: bifunctional serine/threonine-protein kinase/formylglycine-generating enzyme family protein [Kofleriaceae bacterium]|nr:bifunctional serine/threonine-protein kinase/formylglycine-generating enzyme family protein [Kofleriaceae bacterium]